MASKVWTGHLTFGLISIPVYLTPAARAESISFNMLHRTDNKRVKQQLVCPDDKQVVDRGEIVKGYEFRKDEFVIINPEEIRQIEPDTSEVLEVTEFVDSSDVDPVFFEMSYHIVPDVAGQKAYSLVAAAMDKSKYVAVGKLAMHNREYTTIIRHYQGGLMLHTMYYDNEVRPQETNKMTTETPKPEEIKMAQQFFSALVAPWEPKKYKDNFREQIQNLILSKIEGKETPKKQKRQKTVPVPDILEAIKASLKMAEEKKRSKKEK